MNFLEKDLEQIIFETPNDILEEMGLYLEGKKYRQLSIGNYGRADIIYASRCTRLRASKEFPVRPFLHINVLEIKKDTISVSAFLQALRYCKGIKDYFLHRKKSFSCVFTITLIGRQIDFKSDLIYLSEMVSSDRIYTYDAIADINFYSYDYGIDGISFKEEWGYGLINKGF